jgi:hypothetical protein
MGAMVKKTWILDSVGWEWGPGKERNRVIIIEEKYPFISHLFVPLRIHSLLNTYALCDRQPWWSGGTDKQKTYDGVPTGYGGDPQEDSSILLGLNLLRS